MLEEAIPALWSAVHGWFTPAVLFVLLNLVIGTIAVTSKSTYGGGYDTAGDHRKISRVPSLALERLRSFNLSRLCPPAPAAPVAGTLDPSPLPPQKNEEEHEPDGEHGHGHGHGHGHIERSQSEATGVAEAPRLPARMRKSASEKSAFEHFEAEKEWVEALRPATAREASGGGGGRRGGLFVTGGEEYKDKAEEVVVEEEGGEVDARADDFINRFRNQLKLQRLDSIMRYKEMLRRGNAGN